MEKPLEERPAAEHRKIEIVAPNFTPPKRAVIHQARVEEWAQAYQGPKFTAVLSDPPYGVDMRGEGMGERRWDAIREYADWVKGWAEPLRRHVLPGGLGLFFCAGRTLGYMQTGLEMAGWEVMTVVFWFRNDTVPKSSVVSRAIARKGLGDPGPWEGRGLEFRSAYEPCVVAYNPPRQKEGGRLANAVKHGTGTIQAYGLNANGTWTTNLLADADFAGRIDAETPFWPVPPDLDDDPLLEGYLAEAMGRLSTPGFLEAKASTAEREKGLGHLEKQEAVAVYGEAFYREGEDRRVKLPRARVNIHPTVKPIRAIYRLAEAIKPPLPYLEHAVLGVPFAGVGSEMIGALLAGWNHVVGVEMDEVYPDLAEERIRYWLGQGPKRAAPKAHVPFLFDLAQE